MATTSKGTGRTGLASKKKAVPAAVRKRKRADDYDVEDMTSKEEALAKQIAGTAVDPDKCEREWNKRYAQIGTDGQVRIMRVMSLMWDLIYRVSKTVESAGDYYGSVSYEIEGPGRDDWGASPGPRMYNPDWAVSLNVHINGQSYIVHPGSELWIVEQIHEELDEHDAKVQEAKDKANRRQRAVDRARQKLSDEDFQLLGIK